MAENDWALSLATTVANQVKQIRKRRGYSVAHLAELTKEAGYPIGASVLTNFENNRRGAKLDVAELLVLASVLNVPPALLLFPEQPFGEVEALPGWVVSSLTALTWFSGEEVFSDYLSDDEQLGLLLRELLQRQRIAKMERMSLGVHDMGGDMSKRDERIARSQAEVDSVIEKINQLPGTVTDGTR